MLKALPVKHTTGDLLTVDYACLPLCSFAHACEGRPLQAGTPELAYATVARSCGIGCRSGLPWGVYTTTGPLGAAQARLPWSLHLLLVGIAISYGLFSRRNTDADVDADKDRGLVALGLRARVGVAERDSVLPGDPDRSRGRGQRGVCDPARQPHPAPRAGGHAPHARRRRLRRRRVVQPCRPPALSGPHGRALDAVRLPRPRLRPLQRPAHPTLSRLVQVVAGNCMAGISSEWWKQNHNAHHIACNSLDFDPDVQHMPLFAVSARLFASLRSAFYGTPSIPASSPSWPTSSPLTSSRCISLIACGFFIPHNEDDNMWQQRLEEPKFDADSAVDKHLDVVSRGLHPIYVDKSQRRYLVSSDLIDHPLFRVLIERSDGGEGMSSAVIIVREVVLLEYLLQMLRNVGVHPELMPDDLVDFFTFDLATTPTLS
uniref:Fatty acid desaturase domain-containing protein n=1 Tax=Ananas comosus var. bracteatus TaxID=296719 RepID=A0A6V7P932_ANACO|nr:unnamed protein product [Ananas comosus var. bracteatus]